MAQLIVLLLIVVVIAGLFWMLSGRGRKGGKSARHRAQQHAAVQQSGTRMSGGAAQLQKLHDAGVFWGVRLENPGCDASMKLHEEDIELGRAPNLPLPECDAMQCTCTWKGLKEKRHTTRRTQPERRDSIRYDELSTSDDLVDTSDRRSHKERRKGQSTWDRRDF